MDILAGRYQIIKVLGGGGFAVAFLARDNPHAQRSRVPTPRKIPNSARQNQ
ncbi:MAG: hypothetical protein HC903_07990 [Methylacidiphilales bacterium]|nr:hypothetical protein [Candidatus Methylacidiphilales bacterium]NJR17220.1 hypothetical protein [Calothrix sp. CSU_2_0]